MIAVFQGQDVNWDLLQYHYYNGYAYLHHRYDFDIAPAMIQTYYNPFWDVINFLVISLQKPKLIEFFNGAFSGLTCFFLYKIAYITFIPYFSDQKTQLRLLSFISVLIGMTGVGSLTLLNRITNDNKSAMMVIVALYCFLKMIHELNQRRLRDLSRISDKEFAYLILGSFIIGLATGLKLPAGCFGIGIFVALLFFSARLQWAWFILFSFLGFLLSDGYWMFYLYKTFQNPFFPHYNNIFHSSFAPELSFNFIKNQQNFYLYHLFLLPFFLFIDNTLTSEVILREWRLGVLCILLLILFACYCFQIKRKPIYPSLRFIFIFFGASYIVWVLCFHIYRYLLPLEMLSGVLIVSLLIVMLRNFYLKLGVLFGLMTLFVLTSHYPLWSVNQHYQKTFFSAEVPMMPSRTTILVTTIPLSYTIPSFPQDAKFIGMPFLTMRVHPESSTEILSHHYLVNTLRQVHIGLGQNSTYTLSFKNDEYFHNKAVKILKFFGMKVSGDDCQYFKTNIGDNLKLCKVTRIDADFSLDVSSIPS